MYISEGRLCMGIVRFTGNEAVYSDKRSFWKHSYSQGLPFDCFHWFPDVEQAIVLYMDDAIITDTLNMSHEPGTGIKWNRW